MENKFFFFYSTAYRLAFEALFQFKPDFFAMYEGVCYNNKIDIQI